VNSSISSSEAGRPARPYRRFLAAFLAPVALMLPFLGASYLFLDHSGELDSIEYIAAEQQHSDALYGSAVHDNVYAYKFGLLADRHPDVVVIGSSRVLEFRAAYFNAPFVNLGRTVNYPDEAVQLVHDLLKVAHPKLILFGVDYWWFNPKMTFLLNFETHRIRGGELTSDALISPARWVIERKLTPRSFLDILAASHPIKVGGAPMFGVEAITRGDGFAADGSYYYLGTVYGRGPAKDPRFSDTNGRIARNAAQFVRAATPDDQRLATLAALLRSLDEEGMRVITFMPPLAPSIFAAMKKVGQYGYIDLVRQQLKQISPHHYDFLDPETIGADNCEFIDGLHGGDVVAARILARIAEDEASTLGHYANLSEIRNVIKNNTGQALADRRYRQPGEVERDFLKLGCKED
jgi:hypothetical protein